MRGLLAVAVVLVGCGVDINSIPDLGGVGVWNGTAAFTSAGSTGFTYPEMTTLPSFEGLSLRGICGDGTGSIGAQKSNGEYEWTGTLVCQHPLVRCPDTALTFRSGSIRLADGALSANLSGSIVRCGSSSPFAFSFNGTQDAPSASRPQP